MVGSESEIPRVGVSVRRKILQLARSLVNNNINECKEQEMMGKTNNKEYYYYYYYYNDKKE